MSETGEMNGNGAVKRKAPRWMKIVLVISLMLNGLAIGAIGARAWKVHKHGHGYHAMHALGVHSFLRQLPRERRKELRKKFRQVRGELREHGYLSTKPLMGFAGRRAREARRNPRALHSGTRRCAVSGRTRHARAQDVEAGRA